MNDTEITKSKKNTPTKEDNKNVTSVCAHEYCQIVICVFVYSCLPLFLCVCVCVYIHCAHNKLNQFNQNICTCHSLFHSFTHTQGLPPPPLHPQQHTFCFTPNAYHGLTYYDVLLLSRSFASFLLLLLLLLLALFLPFLFAFCGKIYFNDFSYFFFGEK